MKRRANTRKQWIIVVSVALAVLLVLLAVNTNKPYRLTVSFLGRAEIPRWYDSPQFAGLMSAGVKMADCVLLGVTNNDNVELRFHALGVEYRTGAGWHRVIPREWPWFDGRAWRPGSGRVLCVPRPVEVPSSAAWRVQLLCLVDGEFDLGLGPRTNARTRLTQLARKLLRRDTLLFYTPKSMLTPEIPAAETNHSAEGNAGPVHRLALKHD